jgi:aminoglycoside phosphotransferase (APT) family kinase protein
MRKHEKVSEWGAIYRDGDIALKVFSVAARNRAADTMRAQAFARAAGVPVPAVYGIRKVGLTKIALEMAYIDSKPFMAEGMDEAETERAVQVMARLHSKLAFVEAGGLPGFSEHIAREIGKSQHIAGPVKEKLLALLRGMDTGKSKLCHGDMHPGNILFDGETHWMIDWSPTSVSSGDPAADACNTYLYQLRFMPRYAETYLHSYCEAAEIPPEDVLAWLPIIAAYQVNIKDDEERAYILRIINDWWAGL